MIEGRGFILGAFVGVILAAALVFGVFAATGGGSSFHIDLVQPGSTAATNSNVGSQPTAGGSATLQSAPAATATGSTASSSSNTPAPSTGMQATTSATSVPTEISQSSPPSPPGSSSGTGPPSGAVHPVTTPSSVAKLSSETGYSMALLILPLAVGFAFGGIFYGLYRRHSEEETQDEAR